VSTARANVADAEDILLRVPNTLSSTIKRTISHRSDIGQSESEMVALLTADDIGTRPNSTVLTKRLQAAPQRPNEARPEECPKSLRGRCQAK
jgi:hypothetical protein